MSDRTEKVLLVVSMSVATLGVFVSLALAGPPVQWWIEHGVRPPWPAVIEMLVAWTIVRVVVWGAVRIGETIECG